MENKTIVSKETEDLVIWQILNLFVFLTNSISFFLLILLSRTAEQIKTHNNSGAPNRIVINRVVDCGWWSVDQFGCYEWVARLSSPEYCKVWDLIEYLREIGRFHIWNTEEFHHLVTNYQLHREWQGGWGMFMRNYGKYHFRSIVAPSPCIASFGFHLI